MTAKRFIGGPLDGLEVCAITPQGHAPGLRLYFGKTSDGQWAPYREDTPFLLPAVIARYNCNSEQDASRYVFKRYEWIAR